jgi:arsenite methyltransferase
MLGRAFLGAPFLSIKNSKKCIPSTDSKSDLYSNSALSVSNTRSIQKYAKKAKHYDGTAQRTDWIRRKTIELLELGQGQAVLDVGCGSGLSFSQLRDVVGASGAVVGFDQSPHMLEIAHRQIRQMEWLNVSAKHDFGETVHFERQFDAFLFHYTHDILQSPKAIENILRFAKPHAKIAIAGMKMFPYWLEPLNVYAFFKNYAWNGNGSGLRRPWRYIELCTEFTLVQSTQMGMGYIAVASVPSRCD